MMKKKLTTKQSILLAVLTFIAALMLFPVLFTLLNSLMSEQEIIDRYGREVTPQNSFDLIQNGIHYVQFSVIPYFVTFSQYVKLFFTRPDLLGFYWNSIYLVVPVVAGQLLVSVPAAYAFEYAEWKHKEKLFFFYIIVMLLPLQVTLVPNYIMADILGMKNSMLAIILPGIFSPFGTFLVRQQLKGMPRGYYEAAQLDGATNFQFFRHIILPAIRPSMAALAILTFVQYWNVVEQAIVFIRQENMEPLSVYLSHIKDTGMVFSVSAFYMAPALLIFLAGQKQMVQGIQLSGLK